MEASLAIVPSRGAQPVSERARWNGAGTEPAPADGAGPRDKVTISPEARRPSAGPGSSIADPQRRATSNAAGGTLAGAAGFGSRAGSTSGQIMTSARQAWSAALAPCVPSAHDLAVAARGGGMEQAAAARKAQLAARSYGKG